MMMGDFEGQNQVTKIVATQKHFYGKVKQFQK